MRQLKFLMLLLIPPSLLGCAQPTSPVGNVSVSSNYCQIGRPIAWSQRDTPETITQVRRHNAVHTRLCP